MDDAGRVGAADITVLISAIGLATAMYLLKEAQMLPIGKKATVLWLCVGAVVNSWLLTHVAYGARYARLYYREGGLQIPGNRPPDYWDFLYFAFTLGMCFQVSDVVITGYKMRRAALGHAMISFGYNMSILAFTLNLAMGLFSG